MTSDSEGQFYVDAGSPVKQRRNLSLIEKVALSFKRLSDSDAKSGGSRSIWHQGRMNSELLSWEDEGGAIVRQELSFFGHVVEFCAGKPLRTARTQTPVADSYAGDHGSKIITHDAELSALTLEYACHLLKHIPDRDFYTQHLLKHVTDAMRDNDFESPTTLVANFSHFTKRPRGRANTAVIAESRKKPFWTTPGFLIGVAVVLGLMGGAAVALMVR